MKRRRFLEAAVAGVAAGWAGPSAAGEDDPQALRPPQRALPQPAATDPQRRTYVLKKSEMKVPPYQIPLRSLVVRDGKNLLAAGRCFSADQLALSSARVTTSCSMMGQAAGIAAVTAVAKGCDPRELDPAQVRKVVESRGAKLGV